MAPAAGAHARLITTDPANDAVLEQSPRLRAAPVRRAGRDRVRRDPRLRRAGAPGRLGQGRAAEREGSPDLGRPAARARHLHRHLARRVGRRASGLGRVRLPRRRAGSEPGRRRRAGARERNADVGVGRSFSIVTGARLPPAPPRRRRHADAGRGGSAAPRRRRGRGCRGCSPARRLAARVRGARRESCSRERQRAASAFARRSTGTSSPRCSTRASGRSGSSQAGLAARVLRVLLAASNRLPALRVALVPAALLLLTPSLSGTRASRAGSRSSPTWRT